MRTLENKNYKVVFKNENEFYVIKKVFGDIYSGELENGKVVAKSAVGLSQITKARKQLNF